MIIYGTGGHSKVISSALNKSVRYYFDDRSSVSLIDEIAVGKYDPSIFSDDELIVAIGNNITRKKISESLKHKFGKVVASSSTIDERVTIGNGSQLLHNCVVQVDVTIGSHVIINTNASVDHDCFIGDYCHIAPGSVLCGNVEIGMGTLVGAGSTILPGIKIGEWCTIGAGSVVTKDIPDNSLAYGNPVRIIK